MISNEFPLTSSSNGIVSVSDLYKAVRSNADYYIDCSTRDGQLKAYQKCDVVRSVLGKSSSFIANLKVWALDPNTGVQVTSAEAKKELAKLNKPNMTEDFKIWFKKLDQQVKLHGRCHVRKVKSLGEWNYFVIPEGFITPVWGNKVDVYFNRIPEYYIINDGVKSYRLDTEDVHVFYDVTLSSDVNNIYGASRLASLSEVISAYCVVREAQSELYANRGALNIVSMGVNTPQMASLPQVNSEKTSLLERLKKFGVRREQHRNIVTSSDVKVSPLNARMSDMNFDESIKDFKKCIANAYEIPPELLGVESSRFKTIPEARKEAYTQSAITTMEYYISEWLRMRGIYSLPFVIAPDYSHLDFYQEAQLQKGVAFQQMANAIAALSDKTIEGKPALTWEQAQVLLDLK